MVFILTGGVLYVAVPIHRADNFLHSRHNVEGRRGWSYPHVHTEGKCVTWYSTLQWWRIEVALRDVFGAFDTFLTRFSRAISAKNQKQMLYEYKKESPLWHVTIDMLFLVFQSQSSLHLSFIAFRYSWMIFRYCKFSVWKTLWTQ